MSPNTKAVIAFGFGALAAFYALAGLFGVVLALAFVLNGAAAPPIALISPLVALVVAGPAAIILFRYRRTQRRIIAGICRRCGYDLRATSERCPECGTPVPSQHRPRPMSS